MKLSEKKQKFVEELASLYEKLDVGRLYGFPNQKDTQQWLADVASVLKDLDESDYQEFVRLSKTVGLSRFREERKKAAREINQFLGRKVAEWRRHDFEEEKQTTIYIKQEIIEKFINKQDGFDYKKLIKLLGELNSNYAAGYPYSSAMLIRAILDHIPPLLGFNSFKEVVSYPSWSRTDKEYMRKLLDFKNEGNDALHRSISQNQDLLEMDSLPTSNRVNRLLQECLINTVSIDKLKQKQQRQSKQQTKTSRLEVKILNNKVIWANHASDFPSFVWSSFRIELEIDNYNNPQQDYISLALRATDNDGIWKAENFIFLEKTKELQRKPRQSYLIKGKQVKQVEVLISDTEVGTTGQRPMPDIDIDRLELVVITKSGQNLIIPVKAGWIRKG